MNSVSTNKTVARKTSTLVISNKVRRRGQRFPSGSENTNGVSPGGTSSGIGLLICPDYNEVRTRKEGHPRGKPQPAWAESTPTSDCVWRVALWVAHASRNR